MERYQYEEYIDQDYFYSKKELLNKYDKIEINTLYLKKSSFIDKYFQNGEPNEDFFKYFLTNKGLYFFLLNMLDDISIDSVKIQYDKTYIIPKYLFYKIYLKMLLNNRSDLPIIKIHAILDYNVLPDEELLDYIIDESCFNELYYQKDLKKRDEIIDDLLNYITENNIMNSFYLDEKILNRLHLLKDCKQSKLIKKEHIKENYYINESLLKLVNQFKDEKYSQEELAIYIFIRLATILKIIKNNPSINLANIYEITSINNKVNKNLFSIIFKGILIQNRILVVEKHQNNKECICVDNIKFLIDDDINDDYINKIITSKDEQIYRILKDIEEKSEQYEKFISAVKSFDEKTLDIDIPAKNELKTFLEIITRREKITDIEYQKTIFNIFYANNENYNMYIFKIKNKDGNYEFIIVLKVFSNYFIIDENIKQVDEEFIKELNNSSCDVEVINEEQSNIFAKDSQVSPKISGNI